MLKVGDCIRVQTRTLQDVFGVCYYEIVEVGLKSPEKGREEMDGVKAKMLGGSGPSARPGFLILDSQFKIGSEIASGVTEILSKDAALKLLKATPQHKVVVPGEGGSRPATGVMEID